LKHRKSNDNMKSRERKGVHHAKEEGFRDEVSTIIKKGGSGFGGKSRTGESLNKKGEGVGEESFPLRGERKKLKRKREHFHLTTRGLKKDWKVEERLRIKKRARN